MSLTDALMSSLPHRSVSITLDIYLFSLSENWIVDTTVSIN